MVDLEWALGDCVLHYTLHLFRPLRDRESVVWYPQALLFNKVGRQCSFRLVGHIEKFYAKSQETLLLEDSNKGQVYGVRRLPRCRNLIGSEG